MRQLGVEQVQQERKVVPIVAVVSEEVICCFPSRNVWGLPPETPVVLMRWFRDCRNGVAVELVHHDGERDHPKRNAPVLFFWTHRERVAALEEKHRHYRSLSDGMVGSSDFPS